MELEDVVTNVYVGTKVGVPTPYKLDSFTKLNEHNLEIGKFYPRTSSELTGFW